MDEATQQALDRAEDDVAQVVDEILDEVAAEFAAGLETATEIVAARFSVSSIGRMFRNRVPRVLRRLLGITETAAHQTADDVDAELPETWTDLPARYEDGAELPDAVQTYVTVTEHLLNAVGDRLAETARRELAAGVDAGEDMEQLRARLREAFSREAANLGDAREERIARTEAGRAWNSAVLGAAQAMQGPDRPLVKQWVARHDDRVRHDHDQADGQLRLLDEAFTVGGIMMTAPHDPTAPASQVCNCRCVLKVHPEVQASASDSQVRPTAGFKNARETAVTSPAPQTFHGTPGRPSYRKYHPSGRNKKDRGLRTLPGGGVLGSDRFSEEDHLDALSSYNGRGYLGMNGALRQGDESPEISGERHLEEVRRQISALTDLIDVQEPTTSETTLFRGMRVPRRQTFLLAEGDVFHDRGFLSTSTDQRVAQSLAGRDERSVMFTIIAPAGSRMADMNQLRELNNSEQEFILPPGSQFRVRRILQLDLEEEGDSGPAHYELELINGLTADGAPLKPGTGLRASAADFQDRMTWTPEQITIDKRASAALTAADDGSHLMGAMIALVPTIEDADRLALDQGEVADELHCTLYFLGGDAEEWTEDQRTELLGNLQTASASLGGPVRAHLFGVNHWNPDGEDPVWVWAVGADRDQNEEAPTLDLARQAATAALEDTHERPDLPEQHAPWVPHVTGAYTAEGWPLQEMVAKTGPVTFDRIRVAFGGEYTDIPLGAQEEPPMEETAAADVAAETEPTTTRAWSTPGDAALAFEDQETGDGRLFAPGALYWETGPYPLQYADEMGMGHDGAELAGAIVEMGRDGQRITGSGVLYANRYAGADAIQLLAEGSPLGVSVDLDSVDIEFVDRTLDPEEDGWMLVASARIPSMSVRRLADGAYFVSASTSAEWTADGGGLSRQRHDVQFITEPDGRIPAEALRSAFADTGVLTAAAGDSDDPEAGVVVWKESAGDLLCRITRARVRGATLVAMPAFAGARIVLDEEADATAAVRAPFELSAASETNEQVVRFVCSSPVAVGAREVAAAVGITMEQARGHLSRAAKAGSLVRLAPGQYVGPSSMPEGDATAAADTALEDLAASAWTAMSGLPPMPAAWFVEPIVEELPPGSGGVHYKNGRVFGWVAQVGEPHAGMPGRRLTIESLGDIDMSHFHRAKFPLDDGTTVRAGAMTMNVGHHRDGAECETAACQFDDTRTVGAIVVCGMNERGMWFSGAAAPWLSDWDRVVFQATQPSYHLKQGADRRWQLRAVLSVPVPGHSSPLLAAAVERSNLALAASAAVAGAPADAASGDGPEASGEASASSAGTIPGQGGHSPDAVSAEHPDASAVTEAVASLLTSPLFLDRLNDALEARVVQRSEMRDEIDRLAAQMDPDTAQLAAAAVGGRPKGDN